MGKRFVKWNIPEILFDRFKMLSTYLMQFKMLIKTAIETKNINLL